jgi:hypothetical protein
VYETKRQNLEGDEIDSGVRGEGAKGERQDIEANG